MSQKLESPKRRENLTRVMPRRRGETTATTIVPAPEPAPVRAPVAAAPLQIRSVVPPTPPSPAEQALRASFSDPKSRRQFEQLADALLAASNRSTCHSVTLFAPYASTVSADVLSKLALTLSDRKLGRVQILSEDSTYQDLARRFESQSHHLRESRSARQQLRIRLDALRATSRIILCEGGTPSSPLGLFLAQACDTCYLLVELGKTDAVAARAAIATLREGGGNVAGCIVVE